jgi:hypothetical protein
MYDRSATAWMHVISPPVNLARLMAYLAARKEKLEPSNGTNILLGNSSEFCAIFSECIEALGGDELILMTRIFSPLTSLFSNLTIHLDSICN